MTMDAPCPICGRAAHAMRNLFCETHAELIRPGTELQEFVCTACGHGFLIHDIPPALLYGADVALPTDHRGEDRRLGFICRHLDLGRIDGVIADIGGGPGELAEQARRAAGHQRAYVFDFVDRVSFDAVDFVQLDFNLEADRLTAILSDRAHAANLFMLSHVVEHLADPAGLLARLQAFENSVCYIEVPDFGAHHGPELLRFSLNNLDHLHYFTDRSLLTLVQNAGFKVLAFETQQAPLMPALRVLCAPREGATNALGLYNDYFARVADRLRRAILQASPTRPVWVWGLSAFMAKALDDLGVERARVRGVFDTRFPQPAYLGISVAREPVAGQLASSGEAPLIVCGSTYSAVQEVIRAKAERLCPGAEFFAVDAA